METNNTNSVVFDEEPEVAAVTVTEENLYQALGLPNAEERHLKMQLALRIAALLDGADMTQTEAARRTGLAQSDISNIVRGRTGGFTIDRLLKALQGLHQDIEIRVRPAVATEASKAGRIILV